MADTDPSPSNGREASLLDRIWRRAVDARRRHEVVRHRPAAPAGDRVRRYLATGAERRPPRPRGRRRA